METKVAMCEARANSSYRRLADAQESRHEALAVIGHQHSRRLQQEEATAQEREQLRIGLHQREVQSLRDEITTNHAGYMRMSNRVDDLRRELRERAQSEGPRIEELRSQLQHVQADETESAAAT